MPTGNNMIDLEELILKWAKKQFDSNERHQAEKKHGKLTFSKLTVEINRTKFHIEHDEPLYEQETSLGSFAPRTHVLYKSTFTNTTTQQQTFNLRTERKTTSSANFTLTDGYAYGQEISLTVGLPHVDGVEASVGLYREVSFEKTANISKQQEMTWTVDSQVLVPAQTTTTAELVVKEDEYHSKFNVRSWFRGKIYIDILKDNVELTRLVGSNLREIFTEEDGFHVHRESGDVYFETKGVCTCRFGIEQEVLINEQSNKGNLPSRQK